VIHYSLMEMPESGYAIADTADDRIGYFVTAVKDFSNDSRETSFVRYGHRLAVGAGADGSAWKEGGKLVPPKKKIVFWIEKIGAGRIPHRGPRGHPRMEQGRLRRSGSATRIEVRQQESEDFDPEDVTYATLRWEPPTTKGYAIGPSRANPLDRRDPGRRHSGSTPAWSGTTSSTINYSKMHKGNGKRCPARSKRAGSVGNLPFASTSGQRGAARRWETKRADPAEMLPRAGVGLAAARAFCQCGSNKRSELALAAATPARPQAEREGGARRTDSASRQRDDDARGRPHARPAAQFQGQHLA